MTRVVFAVPGDFSAPTGGYGYDRRLLAGLGAAGVAAIHLPLPGDFPQPGAGDIDAAAATLRAALGPGDVALIDGLAYGALPAAAIASVGAPIVALCHHPLCLEAGLAPLRRDALRETETRALALAAHVVVTSPHTGEILARDFGVPASKITIALPGTDPSHRTRGSGGAPALLAVGSIIPRKAFDILVEALADLADLDWSLSIAGSRAHSPETAAALDRLIDGHGLGARVTLLGPLSAEELNEAYARSDVFVSSSLYEGYGMALAEAMARGLPIVTTTGGAAAATVPDAAASKVAPGDAAALRNALHGILTEPTRRARLGEASWRAGRALPGWNATARIVADVARSLA